MSLKQHRGVKEAKKLMAKAKGEEAQEEEAIMARSTTTKTNRFKPKTGSVIPKKRRSVKSMMLEYVLLKLTGSASAHSSRTGPTNRIFPHSPN
ncbi:hypothetical protein L484_000272 [Morus notabilis]|uniref:Uncharacterized protein n=1 Tax=Morus notabilis TaxID=981085 RepID=W9SQ26_9ROSA|nr:hypothetical protein L484_000206 [Morus notabilis]EXC56338.1 hypothetical protein L484_000272 [Morus notabilis]